MKAQPKIGTLGQLEFIVEQKHAIEFAADGMPAVLSTPNLIGLLEKTAREALVPFLQPGERSVGADIDLRHLAATPVGQKVTCSARVIGTEETTVTFQVEARDEFELIARGVHKRAVINVEAFARRVARKAR
jgi:fluoroacetyl-CoA thioesterase